MRGQLSHFTPAEDDALRAAYAEGRGPRHLAPELGRTPKAISRRARMFGLLARGYRPPHKWTAEQTARLLELAEQGYSAGLVAEKLGFSRNAIVGRMFRLGKDFGRSSKYKPRAPAPPPPLPGDLKPLIALGPHDCRYPFGDLGEEGFGFCGAPVRPGTSYCPAHAAICMQSIAQ